jgi:predicted flap endonuclease-1-like 5' DNA nuclease
MKRLALALSSTILFIMSACNGTTSLPEAPMNSVIAEEQVDILSAHKYNIIEIQGIGEVYSAKLVAVGIKYTDDYLTVAAKRTDREKLSAKTGISTKLLLTWANHIDLMRIKGIGPKQSNLLEAIGVDSIKELAQRNADNLYERLGVANALSKPVFVKQLPSKDQVKSWIAEAKIIKSVVEE